MAFYYGEAVPVLSSVLTVDVSRIVAGGIFLRVFLALSPVSSFFTEPTVRPMT